VKSVSYSLSYVYYIEETVTLFMPGCCECCSVTLVTAGMLGFFLPLIVEAILLGIVIGVIIWKRIAVAKFLYNLQVPKMRDIPQIVIQKFRPSSSTPPPELAVHILNLLPI
jgi:hypothetical protein